MSTGDTSSRPHRPRRLAAAPIAALIAVSTVMLSVAGCTGVAETGANGPGAFTHATVGVASIEAALPLWVGTFGLEIDARRDGPDAALSRLWGLPADAIRAQALLRTPGLEPGALHLVEFSAPGEPVRRDAGSFDRAPKNLDVYADDLPGKYAAMRAAGHEFRSGWVESTDPSGIVFREVHMPGHDDINIVLLEVPSAGVPYGPAGFSAIGPLVTIVPDIDAEARFYAGALGQALLLDSLLAGPDIERMLGLPPGAGLALKIYGNPDEWLGRIEIIEYQQRPGRNLYPRARPPALGILHAGYTVPDLARLRARLRAAGVAFTEHGPVDAIYGAGPVISVTSPAGMRLEFQQRAMPNKTAP